MSRKGLKAWGRRRQCRSTVRTWWFVQLTQTSRELLEGNSGKPCMLSQEFLSLEGGGAHLLPPTNFTFDENVHPDPDESRWHRELAAIAMQPMKLHLSLNFKPSGLVVTIRFPMQSGDDCMGASMEQFWWLCRRMICGFYIKIRSRPSIPFLEVYLKTVIMYMCCNLQIKVKNSKKLLATQITTSKSFAK